MAEVDPRAVLESLAQLPICTWNYKTQDPQVRHMGPMAQDFHAAFGLGEDERHICEVDADGVSLAAIQALLQLLQAQDAELTAQRREVAELRARVDELAARLSQNTNP